MGTLFEDTEPPRGQTTVPLAEQPLVVLEGRIHDLGRELCLVAGDEEEIWICSYPQNVAVFKPTQVERVEGSGA